MITRSNDFNAQYIYDDENRLVGIIQNGDTNETTFTYDGLGRLRMRAEGGTTTDHVYDGFRVIQERVLPQLGGGFSGPAASFIPAAGFFNAVSYTRGNDLSGSLEGAGGIGGLLARSSGYSGGNPTTHNHYFADGNGNITYMLNSSQSMVASYRYDPFGNTISQSGTLASANTYRFSSKEIHVYSGLYYFGYRFYDPSLQRWINRDPINEFGFKASTQRIGSLSKREDNLYRFCGNAQPNKIDSFGLDPLPSSTETCCCNGKRIKNIPIKSGLKTCSGKANTVDTDHGWLEMDDGWSADFVAATSIWWGHGVVRSPTDYVQHSDKVCEDVLIHPCYKDKDKFLKAVKEAVAASVKNPPNYDWLVNNCFQWDNGIISDALSASSGCTAK